MPSSPQEYHDRVLGTSEIRARRVVSARGVIIGTALFAFCPSLVRYAAELKPYSGDVLASLIVFGFGIAIVESRFSRG